MDFFDPSVHAAQPDKKPGKLAKKCHMRRDMVL